MTKVLELIKNNPHLTLYSKMLEASEILESLKDINKFTLFAPTDQGIKQQLTSLNQSEEEFLSNKERLQEIIKFHISDSETVFSKDVREDKLLPTLKGESLELSIENDNFQVNGVNVSMRDQVAEDGVVHIIDRVLLPISS